MPYQRSLEIERRLKAVLLCVAEGDYSTSQIARKLGISIPTVSRNLSALRERGYAIHSERFGKRWRYVLDSITNKNEDHVWAQARPVRGDIMHEC